MYKPKISACSARSIARRITWCTLLSKRLRCPWFRRLVEYECRLWVSIEQNFGRPQSAYFQLRAAFLSKVTTPLPQTAFLFPSHENKFIWQIFDFICDKRAVRMSQVWLKPKKFSARFARSIVLYPTLKTIALVTYCTQKFGCPNWRSLATWLGPKKRIFQLRGGIFISRP